MNKKKINRDVFKKCVGEDLPQNASYYNVDFELNQQFHSFWNFFKIFL